MIMAAQIGLLVCSLASQGLGGRSALPSVCLRLRATSQRNCIAASTRRCFSSQRPRPKMPCCCYHDNPGGREKGRKARYEKKRKLGQSRSKPSTSSSSAGGKLHLQRVRVSVLAGRNRSLPPIRYIGRFGLSTNLCFISAGDCYDMWNPS